MVKSSTSYWKSTIGKDGFRFLYFAELLKRPIRISTTRKRIGRLTDLVFAFKEPYPIAVGIYVSHGWGKPSELIPWDRVEKVADREILIKPPEHGDSYPPFVDQPGWIMVDAHLMGRTVVDLDGRRADVVNDVHLLESEGRLLLVHVDMSLSGLLRRWKLGRFRLIKDDFVSWKYVQPLSVEDVTKTDQVALSVTRAQLKELPPEDLADALEELSGKEQEALFSALDSETAAEVLVEAEPRAQRQIIADLRKERARDVLSEMTVPQLVNVFSVLPHDHKTDLLELLKPDVARRVEAILAEREAKARDFETPDFVTFPAPTKVGEAIQSLRASRREPQSISYVYVTAPSDNILLGVVDVRNLLLSPDGSTLQEIMTSPAVSAQEDDTKDTLTSLFVKYQFRSIPVIDSNGRITGVLRYKDVMRNAEIRIKD